MKKLLASLLVCCLLCSCMAVCVWADDPEEIVVINTTGDFESVLDKLDMSKAAFYYDVEKSYYPVEKYASDSITDREDHRLVLDGPAYIGIGFQCKNSEQVSGGKIPMPYALNYQIVVNGMVFDNGKAGFTSSGVDMEDVVLYVTPEAFENSEDGTYTVDIRFRPEKYPNYPIDVLGQVWHGVIVVIPEIVEEEHVHVDADKDNYCDDCEAELYVDRAWDAAAGAVVETLKEIPEDAELITSETYGLLAGKTYVASGNVTLSHVITACGTADDPAVLILKDGCVLTAPYGIDVSVFKGQPFELTICGQANDNGQLYAYGDSYEAGIGSAYDMDCGIITINGGSVYAEGSAYAAGIGGACYGSNGTVTINGGIVTVKSGEWAAGIGGGCYAENGGTVTISGGTVTVQGLENQAIGYGWGGTDNGTLTVNGEYVIKSGSKADDAKKTTLADYTDARTEYVWIHYHNLIDGKCACGVRADGFDYADLEKALEECGVDSADAYTTSSYEKYCGAWDYAKDVLNSAESQDQIDKAAAGLYDAFNGLELKADLSGLAEALEAAYAADTDGCTEESAEALANAVFDGEFIMFLGDDVPASKQDDVDAAAEAILNAIANLEPAVTDPFGWIYGKKVEYGSAALRKAPIYTDNAQYACTGIIPYIEGETDAVNLAQFDRYTSARLLWVDADGIVVAWSSPFKSGIDVNVNEPGCNGSKKNAVGYIISVTLGQTAAKGPAAFEVVVADSRFVAKVEPEPVVPPVFEEDGFGWVYGQKLAYGSDTLGKAPSYTADAQYACTGVIRYVEGETDVVNVAQYDRYTSARILWVDADGKVVAWSSPFKSGVDINVNTPGCNGSKKNAVGYIISVTLGQTAAKGPEAFEFVTANSKFVTAAKKTATYIVHYVSLTQGVLDTKYVTEVVGTVVTEYAKEFAGYICLAPNYQEFTVIEYFEEGDMQQFTFFYMPVGSFR